MIKTSDITKSKSPARDYSFHGTDVLVTRGAQQKTLTDAPAREFTNQVYAIEDHPTYTKEEVRTKTDALIDSFLDG